MAISFVDTAPAWTTSGTWLGSAGMYKDITITGCAVGDVLVVIGVTENYDTPAVGTVVTQSGGTGAWTTQVPASVATSDVGVIAGFSAVTTAGSVTARATISSSSSSDWMTLVAYRIPASEVGSSYGFIGSGFVADADGQFASGTISATSTIIYGAGDWTAGNPGSSLTPTGGTVNKSQFNASHYGILFASWSSQTPGATRNFGPTGLSGRDFTGILFRMDAPASGITGTLTSTLPSFTQLGSAIAAPPSGVAGAVNSILPMFSQALTGTSGTDEIYDPSDRATVNVTLSDPEAGSVSGSAESILSGFVQTVTAVAVDPAGISPSERATASLTLIDPTSPSSSPVYRWNGVNYVPLDTYTWDGTSYVLIDSA